MKGGVLFFKLGRRSYSIYCCRIAGCQDQCSILDAQLGGEGNMSVKLVSVWETH